MQAVGPGWATLGADLGPLHDELALQVTAPLPAEVTLAFAVSVPPSTPAGDGVFLTGDLAQLGPWDPAALPLQPLSDGRWGASLTVPRTTSLAFKLTRGSWDTVEKAADGSEQANREWTAEADATVESTVQQWADE